MSRFLDMLVFGGARRDLPGPPPPFWRRVFHIFAGSSIPLIGIFAPETAMTWVLAFLAAGGLVLDLVRFKIGWLNSIFTRMLAPLLKQDEVAHITGATYMVIAAFLAFAIFGKDVAIPVMFFLSLGDPAAAIVGRDMPGPRLLGKSPLGTAAFFAVGCATLAVLLAADGIDHHWALWVGVAVAGLIELASVPPDDNLAIPVLAGAVMFGLGV
jgi:dolichol kinase